MTMSYLRSKKNVIKVMDRATQTEKEEEGQLRREYLEIKAKYEVVQQEIKRMKMLFRGEILWK